MKNKHLAVTLVTAGLLTFASSALAQTDSPDSKRSGSASRMKSEGAANPDHTFMMKAAQGGMAEVELGQLAKDKASSDAVKTFGQHMIDDHSKANDELKDLASKKNVTLPADVDAKDRTTKDRLSKLSGEAFDRAYMRDMVADHRKDIAEFEREANNGKDPDVKAWAAKTLPTLQNHLKMAEDTERQIAGGKTK